MDQLSTIGAGKFRHIAIEAVTQNKKTEIARKLAKTENALAVHICNKK